MPAFPLYPNTIAGSGSTAYCTNCAAGSWNFNPDIQVPWTDSWNVSFQRVDHEGHGVRSPLSGQPRLRRVGDRELERDNIYETGWLNGEFEKAQANLRANVIAGRGPSMAYMGAGTGTVPLPIMLAHFNGTDGRERPGGVRGRHLDERVA